jgi:hypothetical protein
MHILEEIFQACHLAAAAVRGCPALILSQPAQLGACSLGTVAILSVPKLILCCFWVQESEVA